MNTNHLIPDIPIANGTPSVLVATSFDEASRVALRRGEKMARILEAELVVLHVVPRPSWIHLFFPERRAADALATQGLIVKALDAARAWCEDALGPEAEQPTIIVRSDHVAHAILEVAADVHASFIVMGDSRGSRGRRFRGGIAQAVIQRACRPVLIARAERPNHEIIAATDFTDTEYPALQQAARLAVRLGAHVTFIHNVDASDYTAAASIFGVPIRTTVLPRESDRERREHELEQLARVMGTNIETAVAINGPSAAAILDVARTRDVDLVVVGG